MKALKKAWINAEGFFDFFRARFKGVVATIGNTLSSAFGGFVVFGAIGVGMSTVNDGMEQFIDENAKYQDMSVAIDFPGDCDDLSGVFLAEKGPNGRHTLYKYDGNDVFVAISEGAAEDFADEARECFERAASDTELRKDFTMYEGYGISQPFRNVNTEDAGDTFDYRALQRGGDGHSFEDWAVTFPNEQAALEGLVNRWTAPLNDFEKEQIYDHKKADDVKTFTYTDTYQPYNYNWIKFGVIAGASYGFLMSFAGGVSAAGRERKENRAARRRALDAQNLDF
ncbi:MAG: hypothetical protein NZ828_01615 [Alphaproteobacteria bacterium]|nr:hypothetical protein [Alphaproteobacteria bacterium]